MERTSCSILQNVCVSNHEAFFQFFLGNKGGLPLNAFDCCLHAVQNIVFNMFLIIYVSNINLQFHQHNPFFFLPAASVRNTRHVPMKTARL